MPGPRNSKRRKGLNTAKGKKRRESETCEVPETLSVATAVIDEDGKRCVDRGQDAGKKDSSSVVAAELEELEERLPREPPIYDPGTGPRVKSMGEFLRSSFASEPTWDDELCAEFAQEEMVEMLREVLPEEMALVSAQCPCDLRTKVGGNEFASVYGTTKADVVRAFALPVGGSFKPETFFPVRFKASSCPKPQRTFIRNWWQSRGSADSVRACHCSFSSLPRPDGDLFLQARTFVLSSPRSNIQKRFASYLDGVRPRWKRSLGNI